MEPGGNAMTTLTPELIATLRQLSPEDKDRAIDVLTEDDGPPDKSTPEEWAKELARRAEMVASGNYDSLSLEEAEREVRKAMRDRGIEL